MRYQYNKPAYLYYGIVLVRVFLIVFFLGMFRSELAATQSRNHADVLQYTGFDDSTFVRIAKENISCLYGFKNGNDRWVIQPQFNSYEEYGRFFIVQQNDVYGVVDYKGELIIPLIYEEIKFAKWYDKYDQKNHFYNPTAAFFRVKLNGRWGVVNRVHEILLPIENDFVFRLFNGYMNYQHGEFMSFVDTLGTTSRKNYNDLALFSNDGFAICGKKSKTNGQLLYGIIDRKEKLIIRCDYQWVSGFIHSDYCFIQQNGKIGVVNRKGKIVLKPEYNFPNNPKLEIGNIPFYAYDKEHLIQKANKYGLINTNGQLVVPAIYDRIDRIQSDYNDPEPLINAILQNGDSVTFRNRRGEIANAWYDEVNYISKGICYEQDTSFTKAWMLVRKKDKYGVLNENNKLLFPLEYHIAFVDNQPAINKDISIFMNGEVQHYYCRNSGNPYVVDDLRDGNEPQSSFTFITDGNTSISNSMFTISDGLIARDNAVDLSNVQLQKKYDNGYFVFYNKDEIAKIQERDKQDHMGERVYEKVRAFGDDYIYIITKDHKAGIRDWKADSFIVEPLFDEIAHFDVQHNICWVKTKIVDENEDENIPDRTYIEGYWGVVDLSKNYVLEPEFDLPTEFVDSLAIVWRKYRCGLVKSNGEVLLSCKFHNISMQDSLYFLEKDVWGLADKNGKVLIEPVWTDVTLFLGEHAVFWLGDRMGIINRLGKIIVQPTNTDFSEVPFLVHELFQFTEQKNDYYLGEPIDFNQVLGGYNMVHDYFKARPQLQIAISNFLFSQAIRAFAQGNEWSSGDQYYINNTSTFRSDIYNRLIKVNYSSYTSIEFEHVIQEFTGASLSFVEYRSAFERYTNGEHKMTFINLGFTENDSINFLKLGDLFTDYIDYKVVLNRLLVEQIAEMEDLGMDCSNEANFINLVEDRFLISKEYLLFYLNTDSVEDDDLSNVIIQIPLNQLSAIIKKDGLLANLISEKPD